MTRRDGPSVRLADDRRGRVPFALVGVLLLVASGTFVAGLQSRPAADRPATEPAVDRGFAAVQTDLRTAVRRASVAAAHEPVVTRANTSFGRALNGTTPFRDALRARIYHRTRERLAASHQRVDDVRVDASLPATDDAADLANATERVTLAEPQPGTLRATVANVTVTAARGGRTLATVRRNVTTTVRTPVLVVHRRVGRYQRRLNAAPDDGTGLGLRLTAKLGVIAWARGAAQYRGAPIANVVSNRHVEVATNEAALSVQRSVFGRSDPRAKRGVARAIARTGASDFLSAAGVNGGAWLDVVLPPKPGEPPATLPTRPSPSGGPGAPVTLNASDAADRALYDLLAGPAGPNVSEIASREYTVTVRRYAAVRRLGGTPPVAPRPPTGRGEAGGGGEGTRAVNWTRIGTETTTRVSIDPGAGPTPTLDRGFHRLRTGTRRVDRHVRRQVRWRRGDEVRTTWANRTESFAVGLTVAGDHGPTKYAPFRRVAPIHRPGGALGGPNLADVEARAVGRLVRDEGGWDGLAADAVAALRARAGPNSSGPSALADAEATVVGRRPPALERTLVADLRALRDRVAATNVTTARGSLLANRTPPTELATRLRSRRDALVPVPRVYDGVAGRTRVAVQRAYVDRTVARLRSRGRQVRRTRSELDAALRDAAGVGLDAVQRTLDAARSLGDPPRRPVPAGAYGNLTLRVDGAPAYLTTRTVPPDRVAATVDDPVRPLTARNLNVFTLPTGEAVQGVLDAVFRRSGTPIDLRTAAKTLRAATDATATTGNASLGTATEPLRDGVRRSARALGGHVQDRLAAETRLDAAQSRAVVTTAIGRWNDDVATRALALTNGSVAREAAAIAAARADTPDGAAWRERVRLVAQAAVREDLRSGRLGVDNRSVHAVSTRTRSVVESELTAIATSGVRNVTRRYLEKRLGKGTPLAIPAGLPVTPVAGAWYATVNVWHVDVSGTYARFTVRARRVDAGGGLPTPVAYTRDGSAVEIDLTGDGRPERLGYASRVRFRTTTVVPVVVPPGGTGVGDVDGNMDERSPGWPTPTPRPPPTNRTLQDLPAWDEVVGWPGSDGDETDGSEGNATAPSDANRQPIYPRGRRCRVCSTNSATTSTG